MKISLIVAMASNRVIGLNNKMPWHLSADLKKFKQITMGSPILMGRKTYESIGRPLPGRTNMIISRNTDYQQAGCLVFNNLETALQSAGELTPELFIIGGSDLYQTLLPLADKLYLTLINQAFEGDTYFPEIDLSIWEVTETEEFKTNDEDSIPYTYTIYQRRSRIR